MGPSGMGRGGSEQGRGQQNITGMLCLDRAGSVEEIALTGTGCKGLRKGHVGAL